jgi:hypothetical protein
MSQSVFFARKAMGRGSVEGQIKLRGKRRQNSFISKMEIEEIESSILLSLLPDELLSNVVLQLDNGEDLARHATIFLSVSHI